MQNSISHATDLEFEISGEQIDELKYGDTYFLSKIGKKMASSIHKIIFKMAWDVVSLNEITNKITEELSCYDLEKVIVRFGSSDVCPMSLYTEDVPTSKLFGWVYYKEDDKLETFRFALNVSNGNIKFLNS